MCSKFISELVTSQVRYTFSSKSQNSTWDRFLANTEKKITSCTVIGITIRLKQNIQTANIIIRMFSITNHISFTTAAIIYNSYTSVKTIRTQDILAPSNWCRSVRTVWHQCRNISWTLWHWYRTAGWPLFFNNDFPWLFHDQKNEFPWPIGTAYFFEINETRFMNAYQNKNISSFQQQTGWYLQKQKF